MKNFLILIIAAAILAPAAAHAFSFVDVMNLGKKIFHQDVQPSPVEVKKELTAEAAQLSTLSAENKLKNWEKAYLDRDVSRVFSDSRNLYFTEAEINYLIAQELASATDPVAHDVAVGFSDNLIKVSGYSLVKNFTGQFYLEAKIVTVAGRINFQVAKARYHNFYFPAWLAQTLLRNQAKSMLDFLYSSPDHQNLTATAGSGFIELNYNK
ncbi:MAG: hypothetical protein PHE24_06295 [Patescibacteria group bacterium]|nr:hypothetical protein [Patescibacteria group bacterium]